ncbi:MAG: hypothetical protein KDA79_03090 [Planctomycetaceae bacterium]|nr:hypothetical protein [Planctomycetaceae bacterium]
MSTTSFPTARRTLMAGTILLLAVGIATCAHSSFMSPRAAQLMAELGRTPAAAPGLPSPQHGGQQQGTVLLASTGTPASQPANSRSTAAARNTRPAESDQPHPAEPAIRVAERLGSETGIPTTLLTSQEPRVSRQPVAEPARSPSDIESAEQPQDRRVPPPRDPHETLLGETPQNSQPAARKLAGSSPRVAGPRQTVERDQPREPIPGNRPEPPRAVLFRPLEVTVSPREAPLAERRASRAELDPQTTQVASRLERLQNSVDQLAQAQLSQQTTRLEETARMLQQMQQSTQMKQLEQQLRELQQGGTIPRPAASGSLLPSPPAGRRLPPGSTTPGGAADDQNGTPENNPDGNQNSSQTEPPAAEPHTRPEPQQKRKPVLRVNPNEDSETFTLQIQDTEISQVLEMLGQMAGMNILAGRGVNGTVSANLQNVTVEQALDGILRSMGLVYERDREFIFVMTQAEQLARKELGRKLVAKVYRPNYISVRELQSLIAPILTVSVGKLAITTPSSVGIASDPEQAGGDALSQTDALLVQDYPEVLEEVDRVVMEMDVPPLQVVIEAMILSVKLTDKMQFGVNFALLNGSGDNLVVSGNGAAVGTSAGFPGGSDSIVPPAAAFLANSAGLKYGFISGDVTGFIQALESIADTSLIASPQLRVLNKQKAELIIGDRLSYKTLAINGTTTVENVNFIDSGTKLVLRPFISPDGLVRMEVHPERSSAVINPETQLPNQTTTEVTTNIMVRDGSTAVIGGLIEEQSTDSQERVPLLGSLPLVGGAFRNRTETIDRTEMIVLITPRIIRTPDPEVEAEGASIRYEQRMRTDYFRNHLAPINRRNLARMHYERAYRHFQADELDRAAHHVEEALRHSRNDIDALRLRDQILRTRASRKQKMFPWKRSSPEPAAQ